MAVAHAHLAARIALLSGSYSTPKYPLPPSHADTGAPLPRRLGERNFSAPAAVPNCYDDPNSLTAVLTFFERLPLGSVEFLLSAFRIHA